MIAAVFLLSQALFIVDEREQVIILQFGEPIRTITEPGLAFKTPFIQNLTYFDKRVLSSDATPQEYLTTDKKRLVVDHVTRWRIIDPLEFFKAVRTESSRPCPFRRICLLWFARRAGTGALQRRYLG